MLAFDNRALRALPIDPSEELRPRQVFEACYSRVRPTPVPRPRTLAVAREVAALLDLEPAFAASDEFSQVFAGNRLLPGMDAVAACYGGHQFGSWAGQLGDGRAISLGEAKNSRGEHWELQLKGAGPTPYSRRADGRAVLRSSVREFLCSEAMHHLGIPTTRALCLVATGESVIRDILYDGHPRPEPGAIVCRVAPTFLRFGNYEIFAARGEVDVLKRLVDYTLTTSFPELGPPSPAAYVGWFREVVRRTAELVASWMAVGFVHGVLNTDNMSIVGLTIDYGPFGFLDDYSPAFTPNITDREGRRYRYGAQPRVGLWNLAQLGNALVPLLGETGPLEEAIRSYHDVFRRAERRHFAAKLGLRELSDDELGADGGPRGTDSALLEDLFELLTLRETDYSIFFRRLALVGAERLPEPGRESELLEPLGAAFYAPSELGDDHREKLVAWLGRYVRRVREDGTTDADRRARMDAVNPKFLLRNYVAQLAIERAEAGDATLVNELLEVLRRPFDEQPGKEEYAEKRPEWARNRAGCSMLSCSS
jgi:serine/tyrosine/threonine adenylyltransferase